jgi:hypothetical protein
MRLNRFLCFDINNAWEAKNCLYASALKGFIYPKIIALGTVGLSCGLAVVDEPLMAQGRGASKRC